MEKIFNDLEKFKLAISKEAVQKDVDSIFKLDLPYFEAHEKLVFVQIPNYPDEKNLAAVSKKDSFVYSKLDFNSYKGKYKSIIKRPHGESTLLIFHMIKSVLKNYSEEFRKIRNIMNELDLNPVMENIEEVGRDLRRLTDRLEGLVEIVITLKENEIKQFNVDLIPLDYDILNTEARYWLERCRSHIYRIATLRTKSEIKSNRQLNDTMSRLTVIMTILTIVSIVVSVPGTIGAIFGIPALSDAYFSPNTPLLVLVLIGATLLSIVLGYAYWKSLGLRYVKPK